MFEILLEAYRDQIYQLKWSDIQKLWKKDKRPCLLMIGFFVVLLFWLILFFIHPNMWMILPEILCVGLFVWIFDSISKMSPQDRRNKEEEKLTKLEGVLEELDLYSEDKLDLILVECELWFQDSDRFSAFVSPVHWYGTVILIPTVSFFTVLVTNWITEVQVQMIISVTSYVITFLVIAGMICWVVFTYVKPVLNRKRDAAKSLQMRLLDLKLRRFAK